MFNTKAISDLSLISTKLVEKEMYLKQDESGEIYYTTVYRFRNYLNGSVMKTTLLEREAGIEIPVKGLYLDAKFKEWAEQAGFDYEPYFS